MDDAHHDMHLKMIAREIREDVSVNAFYSIHYMKGIL